MRYLERGEKLPLILNWSRNFAIVLILPPLGKEIDTSFMSIIPVSWEPEWKAKRGFLSHLFYSCANVNLEPRGSPKHLSRNETNG